LIVSPVTKQHFARQFWHATFLHTVGRMFR
jgi:hypothetical protein